MYKNGVVSIVTSQTFTGWGENILVCVQEWCGKYCNQSNLDWLGEKLYWSVYKNGVVSIVSSQTLTGWGENILVCVQEWCGKYCIQSNLDWLGEKIY